jgi:RNA recognition motif-containing protein
MQVLEIVALRKDGLRGQAFVVFEDVQAATAALQAEQGFTFFGKDLKLAYAKEKSDRIAKRDGTFVPRAKRRKRDDESAVAAAAASAAAGDTSSGGATGMETTESGSSAAPPLSSGDAAVAAATATTPQQQPTHILFAESLPSECNEMMLAMLFRQVRTILQLFVSASFNFVALCFLAFFRHSVDRSRESCSILHRS